MDNFEELDVKYSRECCGEIYIIQKRYLVFHCCQCTKKYNQLSEYLRHICNHYEDYAEENDFYEKPENSSPEPLICNKEDNMLVSRIKKTYTKQSENEYDISIKEEALSDTAFMTAEEVEDKLIFTTNELKEIEVEDFDDETEGREDENEDMEDEIDDMEDEIEDMEDEIVDVGDEVIGIEDEIESLENEELEEDIAVMENVSEYTEEEFEATESLGEIDEVKAQKIAKRQDMKIRAKTKLERSLRSSDTNQKKINDKKQRHKCEYCEASYTDKSNLRAHIRQKHIINKRMHTCTYCSKKFLMLSQLVYHQRVHTGEKPFLCYQCGSRFPTVGRLSTHVKRHSNQRTHKCDECEKKFFDKRMLTEHMLVHTKERNFSCSICNKRFCRNKTLQQHLKIHANLREYVCHICQQSFNQSPGLRGHLVKKHKICNGIEEIVKLNNA